MEQLTMEQERDVYRSAFLGVYLGYAAVGIQPLLERHYATADVAKRHLSDKRGPISTDVDAAMQLAVRTAPADANDPS